MSTLTRCFLVAAGVLSALTTAHADIVVLRADGSNASQSQATRTYNQATGGWDIHLKALYAPGGVTSYTIRANGGETIDNVWIDVPCWENSQGDCIPAGSPVFVRLYSDGPDGLRTIHNIDQIGTAESLLMHAEATHDIGSVSVQTINSLVAGRDVLGPIIGTTPDNAFRGVESVVAGRDVRGDVIAQRGRVNRVEAGRHIGSAFNPVEIRSKHDQMRVIAGQDIRATVKTGIAGGSGYLARLHCDRFFGSIDTPHIGSANTQGRVEIREQVDGMITIGGSLTDNVDYFVLPPGGLTGQIIINANNESNGSWDVPIHLGPVGDPETIVLEGPLYDLPSEMLGGGAVGVAPFRLHDQSCNPPNGSTVTQSSNGPPLTIALQHYGPVTWFFGSPVIIERRMSGTEAPYSEVSLSDFEIYRSYENPTRVIVVPLPGTVGFEAGYQYRIRPTSQLRCDIVGEPLVQWQSNYIINIESPACVGDLTNNGAVDTSDLLVLLAHWGPVSEFSSADLNGDGVVDVVDLLLLLSNWGPCTSYQHAGPREEGRSSSDTMIRR